MAKPELSPTMQACVNHMRQHGGMLVRYPGGFWCRDGLMEHAWPWFGTSTIEAIVARGVAAYSEWKENAHGRFPIKLTLNHPLSTDEAKQQDKDPK